VKDKNRREPADENRSGDVFYPYTGEVDVNFFRAEFHLAAGGCGIVMQGDGGGLVQEAEAGQAAAQAQVYVLVVGEEVFVEEADGVEE